jgi:adenylate cyclase
MTGGASMPGSGGASERVRRRVPKRFGLRRRPITIRYSLARNLMLMILLTSGAILVVSYVWGTRVVAELSEELISQRIDQTEQELQRFFMPVENGLLLLREWGSAGILEKVDTGQIARSLGGGQKADTTSVERLNQRFVPLLEQFRQVSSLMIADTGGGEYLLLRLKDHWLNRITEADLWGGQSFWMRREEDGTYTDATWKEIDYDPRGRPWFRGGLETPRGAGVHWTEPYKFFTTKDPGITASLHWREPGEPGVSRVMAFDMALTAISRFTTALTVSEHGKALVLTEDGAVVGLPRDPRFSSLEDLRAHVLNPLTALGLPEIDAGVRAWNEREIGPGSVFAFESGDHTWWAGVRPFPLGDRAFRIAVVVPERDFLAEITRQRNTVAVITAAALVVAFFVAMRLARRYSQPLAALAAQAERIQQLDIAPSERIDSRLREVNQLADTQERMRTALDSFSRYVPIDVVRELMKRDAAAQIGGARCTITVLFTDIQGFTTIAEALTPEALTHHMSEYFEAMLGTVQSDGYGEVTQLAGDGFVAFWGAPIPSEDHVAQAVESVLRCRERLAVLNAQWSARGLPELPTRFGLATGPVVVGNVGSPARLVYTAVGDTINLASRLEGLNRFYGTWVLVCEDVRRAAGEAFAWRQVDRVRAKGKQKSIDLYQLLGRAGEVGRPLLEFSARYEAALRLYRRRSFRDAASALEQLTAGFPDDLSVARLLELARDFQTRPPDEGWDGTTVFQEK